MFIGFYDEMKVGFFFLIMEKIEDFICSLKDKYGEIY